MAKSDKGLGKKRKRDDADGDDGGGPSTSGREATIGMQTSSIKNKQARSEMYAKLKHKQKVCLNPTRVCSVHAWLACHEQVPVEV